MKIKTKLRAGFGFLFVIVLGFGLIALFFLNQISSKAKLILKDNYKTIGYVAQMRSVIDDGVYPLTRTAKQHFEQNLELEKKNITEPGEKLAVNKLATAYSGLLSAVVDGERRLAEKEIRSALAQIEFVNMQAIKNKNDEANNAYARAEMFIAIAASFCFIVLFTFVVNFPGFVANPLAEFSQAIKQVGNGNYLQRLHFNNNDEFTELASSFNSMAKKLHEWENSNLSKLKSEKSRIEAIIAQMQDAIIGVNEKGEVLFLNQLAAKLIGVDEQTTIGQNVGELMQRNELLKNIIQPQDDNRTLKIYADERESFFQLESREIVVPNIETDDNQPLSASSRSAGNVYVLKNVTKFKELDQAKTNFIATVSHELKTPLSSIKMSLKLLGDKRVGEMNKEQHELLQHIQEDSDRLLKITSELLDLSQVESGNLKLSFVLARPIEIVRFAIDAVKFQAEQKSIQLELNCNEQLPEVNVDIQKTAWVLVNFLSNALRYSAEKAKIIIQVIEKNGQIEFSVKDFGKGIEEKYQKRLFDRYFQVPTDGQNKSGSGLGLAISKDFIEAESGMIWVESAIGEGSRFCFILPRA
ncbi:HAMP domain-containing protein [Pedobacter frigiditerrae]|uniref:histidine kinase n=1 Tax=Pedobacter frigiditerrae TaxID=2530452 RepID=A0A4R0MWW3_9SPHI|nr:ATP-binding protein [Pedobacter frigiditerrae]TCC91728.1 HAMP domain-containing protein [Pedobacter frigiditerrae]